MEKINIMINGLPGNVAFILTEKALRDDRFCVLPFSLTGQEIEADECLVEKTAFELVRPDVRDEKIKEISDLFPSFISIDYTHPSAVNDNARFYIRNRIPFVMGTTGGDRDLLEKTVSEADIPAVIAPNMAKQIVGFQAMMAYGATTFPDLFKGYNLTIKESHQNGKADTSGTARAMVGYFNTMGIDYDVDQIEMVRDPDVQENRWGIPGEHLAGHAWHTYTLTSPDGSALFEFKHNINGRDIYAAGTFDAVVFLNNKLSHSTTGQTLFSMIDVLSSKE
ncbi:MAG: dihydrodipicolinate reductase [Desulfobacterales bacterium]|nr:dihydrodipicolinate reductase [Desulfobacterales bacterium]